MCCLLKRFMLIRKEEHVLSAEGFMLIRNEGNMCCLLNRLMLIRKEGHVLFAEDVYIHKKGGTCVVC